MNINNGIRADRTFQRYSTYEGKGTDGREKDKAKITKRRQKTKQQKAQKRKMRLIKGGAAGTMRPEVIERPGMPNLGAPEGFRSISFSQAIMKYGQPLLEQAENENTMNAVLQLSSLFSNYALSARGGTVDLKIEKEIIKEVRALLGLDMEETRKLIKTMVARYHYLFPEDIQPKPPSAFMFIRKEVRHPIRPFDCGELNISDRFMPPDADDQEAIDKLTRLDALVMNQADYEQFESLLTEVKDRILSKF